MADLMAVQDLELAYYQELFGVAATDGLTLPDLRYIYFLNAYNGTLPFLTSDTITKVEKVTQAQYDALPQPRPATTLYVITP
jgi:hypothetical protein